MDKSVYDARAGFLVGGNGTCPQVGGAGSCPSGGQGCVGGVFIRQLFTRKTLSSLSAEGCGCVPAMFVVWPEVSQHWSLQALWWGQVFVKESWPPRGLTPMSTPQNCHCQCPCLHSESQPLPTCAEGHQILSGKSGPVSYEVTTFFPGSWCAQDLVCGLQEWSFYLPQSCCIPQSNPTHLQSQILWGFFLLLPDP